MKVFKYRSANRYNIDYFIKNQINGTLFKYFDDQGELDWFVDKNRLKKNKIILIANQVVHHLIDNCRSHYYLSCFSSVPPASSQSLSLWDKFTSNCGFCLEYDEREIMRIINHQLWLDIPYRLHYGAIQYIDDPYDFSEFINEYFDLVGDDLLNKERHKFASDNLLLTLSRKNKVHIVTNSLLRKKKKYDFECEYRIYGHDDSKHFGDYVSLFTLKPKKVYIPSSMNVFDKNTIINHCLENEILFEIVNLQSLNSK